MAYAHVQSVAADAATATITASTAGTLLVFSVFWSTGASDGPATVTSGFTAVTTELAQNGGGYSSAVYHYPNNPGGITSVGVLTWVTADPGSRRVYVSEYSGIATSSPVLTFAKQSQTTPGTGANAVSSSASTVTLAGAPGALIYGFAGEFGSGVTMNVGTDRAFTSRVVNDGNRVEDLRITSDGSNAATFTAGTAPDSSSAWMVAFAEAGGGVSYPIGQSVF